LVAEKIPIERDFILLKAIALLRLVIQKCSKEALNHEAVAFAALELIKWVLLIIRDRSQKTTPEL